MGGVVGLGPHLSNRSRPRPLERPYETWQLVGCVATLAVLVLVAGALHHPLLALVTVLGTAAGTAALAFAADMLRTRTRA